MAKPLPDRIASTRALKDKAAARLAVLEAKARVAARKRDTRRKIVIGAAVLSEMERTPRFAAFVRDMLAKAVTRPLDRAAIDDLLIPSPAPASHPTAANAPGSPVVAREKMAG